MTTPGNIRSPRLVFISYSHEDKQFAHKLKEDLERQGWQVWIAPESIGAGMWQQEIEHGLARMGVFIPILSPAALQSMWVQMEISISIDLHNQGMIQLRPVLYKQCDLTGKFIGQYQYVSFVNNDYDGTFQHLVFVLNESISQRHLIPIPIPQSANPLVLSLTPDVTLELVRVPAGEFLMGSTDHDDDAEQNEKPQRPHYLDEFLIGKYDVTNAQFRAFIQGSKYLTTADTGLKPYIYDGSTWDYHPADWQHPHGLNSALEGKENHPVVCVTLQDAKEFCAWASQVTGKTVTLPSEAQWEKAARGIDGRIYPWGNQIPDSDRINYGEHVGDTTLVGKYSPQSDSPFGAADMAGNVWQLTDDNFDENYYQDSPYRNPQGPTSGQYIVLRGGSWAKPYHFTRAAYRSGDPPGYCTGRLGFRVVII